MKVSEVRAAKILKKGGVVVFPTDTVWGMGASVESEEGIKKLYQIKKRERGKPTAVLVADIEMAKRYGVIEGRMERLAEKYWPGALTLVVRAKGSVPGFIQRGGKVGLRVASHDQVIRLCRKLNGGIVAGSANFAGEGAPRREEEINLELVKRVDGLVGGLAGGQEASSVVEMSDGKVGVLREGPVEISITN